MKLTEAGIPAIYDYRNLYNASFAPSTIHVQDTGLSFYFQRYLIQKIMAVFDFKGIPKTWDKSYFMKQMEG